MPIFDLSDDEHAALTAAIRRLIEEDRFPQAPRLDLHAQLAPLERYGLPGLGSAITNGVFALTRALRGALYRDEP